MHIKTAGDLRGFLAQIMVGIKDGSIKSSDALAISKVAAQINQSLSVEVNTALQLERMGKDHPVAGSMLIASEMPEIEKLTPPATVPAEMQGEDVWCDQCDGRISIAEASACKSKYCAFGPNGKKAAA